jgi:hypothetical protein
MSALRSFALPSLLAVAFAVALGSCGDAVTPNHSMNGSDGGGANCCGSACVDLMLDPLHCGACDHACPSGDICFGGRCGCPPFGTQCSASQTCCGANGCVGLQGDIRNCGGCGVKCPDGVACVNGSCAGAVAASTPPPGFCACSDSCAGDPDRLCVASNCCHADYVAGKCTPDRSCGTYKYK